MSEVALTDIRHGLKDGTVVTIKAGDKIPATIDKASLEILREVGSVGDAPPTAKEVEDKDAQIAELKAQLEAAQAALTAQDDANPPPAK